MNSNISELESIRNKEKLQISSAALLVLLFAPLACVLIFFGAWNFLILVPWQLLYCCPFAIAGISGLLISRTDNPTYMKALIIIFICLLVYCAVNVLLSFIACASLTFDKITSSGNWDKSNNDDTGLRRGVAFMFLVIFGLSAVYFIFAIWMAWRGINASIILRNILTLRGSPGGYQQFSEPSDYTYINLPNYQPHYNSGYTNISCS